MWIGRGSSEGGLPVVGPPRPPGALPLGPLGPAPAVEEEPAEGPLFFRIGGSLRSLAMLSEEEEPAVVLVVVVPPVALPDGVDGAVSICDCVCDCESD